MPDFLQIKKIHVIILLIGLMSSCVPHTPLSPTNGTKPTQSITVTSTPEFEPSITPTKSPTALPTPQPFTQGILIVGNYEQIYRLDLESSETTLLDDDSGFIHDDVNAVGDTLYYLRTMPNDIPGTAGFGPGQVYRMKLFGTDFTRLTYTNDYEMGLTASPDGATLAYWSDNNNFDQPDRYKLQIYDTGSGALHSPIQNSENQYGHISWSPDSERLVFFEINYDDLNSRLYLYDLMNDVITEISSAGSVPATRLAWSPDGESLVMPVSNGSGFDLTLYQLDTGVSQKIIRIAEIPDNLQWSPDGKNILFEIRKYTENDENSPNGLFLLNPDSGNIETIQKDHINHGLYSYNAQWFADGSMVEYAITDDNDHWKIYLLNIETKEQFEITLPEPYDRYSNSWKIIEKVYE